MDPLESFFQVWARADDLLELHRSLAALGRPPEHLSDLLRASVVITVAGLDSYVHEKVLERCSAIVRERGGRNLPGKLMDVIKENSSHEKLVEIAYRDRPTSHIVGILRSALELKTFQDPGQIENAMKVLGIKDLWRKLGEQLEVSEKQAKRFVEPYVTRRHQIVHDGDLFQGTKKRWKVRPITRAYADACHGEIGFFVFVLNDIIDEAT